MPHMIEQFHDGTAAFFSNRETPWHRLGTVTDGAQTAEDAMRLAQLDWDVEKHPMQTVITDETGVTVVDVPGRYATVRQHPKTHEYEVLGAVGEDYTVVQNMENCEFLDALVDESGAHFETAGSLKGGKQTFVTMKLPNTMRVGGEDPVDLYLCASNSHDGSRAFRVDVTPIRVVCNNTLSLSMARAKRSISLRHTSGVTNKIQQARETLDLTFQYTDELQAELDSLYAKPLSEYELSEVIDNLWVPAKDDDGKESHRTSERRNGIVRLFTDAPTQEVGRGTAWGGLNAITEYLDWGAWAKSADKLAERVALGTSDHVKARALQLLSA